MNRRKFLAAAVAGIAAPTATFAQCLTTSGFTLDLSGHVPFYSQEKDWWCGPACVQMIRNGYPNPADRQLFSQCDLWKKIRAGNESPTASSELSAPNYCEEQFDDPNWATDPKGLRECLMGLNNPPGVNWVESANPVKEDTLAFFLFWMNQRQFPTPTVTQRGSHWRVIVGFETDVAPLSGTSATLNCIIYYDPELPGGRVEEPASTWNSTLGGWGAAVARAGTWQGKYVAIVEPPVNVGKVSVKEVRRTGTHLISASAAVEQARRVVRSRAASKNRWDELFTRRDVEVLTPMLVREGMSSKDAVFYYLVPIGQRNERGRSGGQLARGCVLVNAFTSALEGVMMFGAPMEYLLRDEALRLVSAALGVPLRTVREGQATLMFESCDITHLRPAPFWRIQVHDKTLYVDQARKLHSSLQNTFLGR